MELHKTYGQITNKSTTTITYYDYRFELHVGSLGEPMFSEEYSTTTKDSWAVEEVKRLEVLLKHLKKALEK